MLRVMKIGGVRGKRGLTKVRLVTKVEVYLTEPRRLLCPRFWLGVGVFYFVHMRKCWRVWCL